MVKSKGKISSHGLDVKNVTLNGLRPGKSGFGCKMLRKLPELDAAVLVRRAFEGGLKLFSTSHEYEGTEAKVALGLANVPRKDYLLSSGVRASDGETFDKALKASLKSFGVRRIDIYKLHDPVSLDLSADLREAMERAKAKGKVKVFGVSTSSLKIARAALEDELFGVVEYPINSLSSDEELEFLALAEEKNVRIFAQKPMAGGLLPTAECAYAFLRNAGKVHALWGIEYPWQLGEILALEQKPPKMQPELWNRMHAERAEYAARFCRGCGECMPCPAGIDIPFAARVGSIARSQRWEDFATGAVDAKMRRAAKCVGCGHCAEHCPYHLNVRELLRRGVNEYRDLTREHGAIE